MSLYRVLFVDYEATARDDIISKIDWDGCGFEVVGRAENGRDALELAKHINPDLVIINIELPLMNGLIVCKSLSKLMPRLRFIVTSDSDNFKYAQQAIKINVAGYILKPVNVDELKNILRKLKVRMDRRTSNKQNVEMLQKYYDQTLPMVKNQFLSDLIEGRFHSGDLQAEALRYDLNMTSKSWVVAIVRTVEDEAEQILKQKERNLVSAKNIFDETMMRFCRTHSFVYKNYVVIIAMLDNEYMVNDFVDRINNICKKSSLFLEFGLSVGIGLPCGKLEDLNRSYTGALRALDYQAFKNVNKAIYIGEIDPNTMDKLKFNEQDELELLSAIKIGSEENIKESVNKLFAPFSAETFPLNQCYIFLLELLAAMVNLARSYKFDMEEIFKTELKDYLQSGNFNLRNLNNWVCEGCLNISTLIKRERMSTTKLAVEKAKQFVNEHYSNSEISVEMLCDYLHMNPAYFSTIFKRESGTNFVDYLTTVRLEAAVKLLNSTEKKFSSICSLVGYSDPNYFSYVFKKRFGVSPSKYKNNK